MDDVIYQGLQCSFESGNGRYLLVRRAGEPLRSDELAGLDMRMLQRNSVPHLFPLDVEEINGQVTLRYRIPAVRSLKQVFQSSPGDMKQLLELLHSIVLVLEDSRLYMLDETKYILHPSLILVGKDVTDPYLIYLPLHEIKNKPSIRQSLYQLTLTLLDWASVPVQVCPVLLDCLKSSLFDLTEFKRLLIGLQIDSGILRASSAGKAEQRGEVTHDRPVVETESHDTPFIRGETEEAAEDEPVITPLLPLEQKRSPDYAKRQVERLSDDGDTLRFSPKSFRVSPSSGLRILLVALALVWLAVALKPQETVIWLAVGLSLILVLVYTNWNKRAASASRAEEESDGGDGCGLPQRQSNPDILSGNHAVGSLSPVAQWKGTGPTGQHPSIREVQLRHQPNTTHSAPPNAQRTFGWTEEQRRLYAENPAQTVMLQEPGPAGLHEAAVAPTELLLPETRLLLPQAAVELQKEGGTIESITIDKDRFVFGRSPADNDLVLAGAGISRVHGEIIREGKLWLVRDLNSRNGSKLNGESMVPGQAYELKNGDSLSAADTPFIFRVL